MMSFKLKNKGLALRNSKGFTLIEILVVIGIVAILASIVIIAINPAKQFAQARNAQRTANVNAILNAIGQRIADNKGVFEGPFSYKDAGTDGIKGTSDDNYDYYCDILPTTASAVNSTMGTKSSTDTSGDLGCLVPTYIPALPTDPIWVTGDDTKYKINKNATTGRISVCAPLGAEATVPDSAEICVIR